MLLKWMDDLNYNININFEYKILKLCLINYCKKKRKKYKCQFFFKYCIAFIILRFSLINYLILWKILFFIHIMLLWKNNQQYNFKAV